MAAPRVFLVPVLLGISLARVALALPWDAGAAIPEPGLRVRGGLRVLPGAERELFALVTLSLPLDSVLFGAMAPRNNREASPAVADGPEPETVPSAAPPPPAPPRSTALVELTPRLARDAVRIALRVAGFPRSGARLESLGSRARTAGLVPDLRVRGGRTTDESMRWAPTEADPYRYTQAGGNRLYLEAELGWKLGRLVFADAELRIEELARQRQRAQRELAAQVLAALFEWQRARLRAANPSFPAEERAEAYVAMIRAASELDVLTDGWFERRVRSASARLWLGP